MNSNNDTAPGSDNSAGQEHQADFAKPNDGNTVKVLTFTLIAGAIFALVQLRGPDKTWNSPTTAAPRVKRELNPANTIEAGVATTAKVKELKAAGENRNAEVESFFK